MLIKLSNQIERANFETIYVYKATNVLDWSKNLKFGLTNHKTVPFGAVKVQALIAEAYMFQTKHLNSLSICI